MEKRFGLERPELEFGVSSRRGDDLIEGIDDDSADGTRMSQLFAERTSVNPRLQIIDVNVTGRVADDDEIAARSENDARSLQSREFQSAFEAMVKELVSAHGSLLDIPRRRHFDATE